MSPWSHVICTDCWNTQHPDKEPVVLAELLTPETCCFCGQLTDSGIYVRHDPNEALCKGVHEAQL
jgi:hypothetical protein